MRLAGAGELDTFTRGVRNKWRRALPSILPQYVLKKLSGPHPFHRLEIESGNQKCEDGGQSNE